MSGSFTVRIALDLTEHCNLTPLVHTVNNHGIPEEVISNTLAASKRFFALPETRKKEVDIRKSTNFKGYTSFMDSSSDPDGAGDLHEGLEWAWEEMQPKEYDDEKRGKMGLWRGSICGRGIYLALEKICWLISE